MAPYFIILLLTVLLAKVSQNTKIVGTLRNFFIGLNGAFLVLFSGLRNASVGTDTGGYARRFIRLRYTSDLSIDLLSTREVGYQLLQKLAFFLSQEYYSLLLLTTFVIIFFQFKGIYKLSLSPIVSLFVFICFGFYTFSFNGLRQGIALAVFVYAIQFIVAGKFSKYLLFVIIAFLFHKTAIITLPIYFIARMKFSFKLFFIYSIATSLIVVFFDRVLNMGVLLSEKYVMYQDMDASGGQMLTLAYILLSAFFIFVRKFIKNKDNLKYDVFLNTFLIGTIIYIVVQLTGAYIEMTRLAIYFLAGALFLWPIILKEVDNSFKRIVSVFFVIVGLTFYYIFLTKIGNLLPYKLNSELFI